MDVVSCCEMDVLGVDCAAFDCHVFFGDDGGCPSCGDPASFCFFGNGFRMVFQAFDVGAFHYLVKPLSDDKFCEVFENAVQEIESRKKGNGELDEEYMMIQAGGDHTKILLKDIIYAEVFNRKVIIHTVNGDTEYYGNLSNLEKKAGEDFFRTHRSYLIHFRFVHRYDAASVTMEKGTVLIAKQNYPEFVKQYLKYNQRKGREIK